MKKKINGILVVEGLHDKNLIESFYDVDFVVTHGFDINLREINYLNSLPDDVSIIILTDPDISGDKIRKKLELLLNRYENANVNLSKCSKHNKHGVAECDIKELNNVLDKFVNYNGFAQISEEMLLNLGVINSINSNKIIDVLSNTFNLGLTNKSNILKRLNNMHINYNDLKRTISENGY